MAKPLKWKKGESADAYMTRSWASLQKRKVNRALGRGGAISADIEGLEEFRQGLDDFERQLSEVVNDILRGEWGEELLEQVRAELSDHKDSGETRKHLGIWDDGRDVHVGHAKSAAFKKHPFHSRANFASIMNWLESGTEPHPIPRTTRHNRALAFNGRVVRFVNHPGHKGFKIMRRSLRVFASEGERLVLEKLGERLQAQMRAAGAIDGGPA